ncbi:MAG: diversity-generating retroelement protein Avd [Candidatus Parcubacteria bacterium]|nr:diversity-generating retroelement protein Avd [Candidatus Parcubacteria bacterium]
MYKDTPILQKTYEIVLWLYPTINKFPKNQRFVLGQRLENTILSFTLLLIRANYAKNKASILEEAREQLYLFIILIRLAKDLKFISLKQYEFVTKKIYEVGKMLGGWLNYSAHT